MSRNILATSTAEPRHTTQRTSEPFEFENVNKIRLEHFQNYKKLRREMDRAYLKVRHLQATGHGGISGGTSDIGSDYTSDNNTKL